MMGLTSHDACQHVDVLTHEHSAAMVTSVLMGGATLILKLSLDVDVHYTPVKFCACT